MKAKLPLGLNGRQVISGLAAATIVGGGAYLASEYVNNPQPFEDVYDGQIKIVSAEPNPSTLMSDGFKAFTDIAEIAGYAALGYGAYRFGKRAVSSRQDAIHSIASAERKKSHNFALALGGATAVATVSVFGTYVALADGTAKAQRVAAEPFLATVGTDKDVQVLSTAPQPELFNSPSVPIALQKILNPDGTLGKDKLETSPVVFGFNNILLSGEGAGKILASTYAAPSEAIDIDASDDSCKTVKVEAPKELGVAKGETFNLDGLTVTVEKLTEEQAGVNLFPIGMTIEDYNQCLNGGAAKTPNILLVEGSNSQVKQILRDADINVNAENENEPENRVYVVPVADMLNYSQKTGENTVNGLVSLALMTGSIFIGISIGGNNRNAYKNDQLINATRLANGFSKKDILAIYADKAESMAYRSWATGVLGVIGVTATANMTMAGASMGLDVRTAAASLGYIMFVAKATNSIVGKSAVKKANIAEITE